MTYAYLCINVAYYCNMSTVKPYIRASENEVLTTSVSRP